MESFVGTPVEDHCACSIVFSCGNLVHSMEMGMGWTEEVGAPHGSGIGQDCLGAR